MKVVAFIAESEVVDRILRHIVENGANDPHEGQDPPIVRDLVPADVAD